MSSPQPFSGCNPASSEIAHPRLLQPRLSAALGCMQSLRPNERHGIKNVGVVVHRLQTGWFVGRLDNLFLKVVYVQTLGDRDSGEAVRTALEGDLDPAWIQLPSFIARIMR